MSYNTINSINLKAFDRFKMASQKPVEPSKCAPKKETMSEKKSFKVALALVSFAGALVPLAIKNRKVFSKLPEIFKNGGLKQKAKGILSIFDIQDGKNAAWKSMTASGLSAVVSGFTLGMIVDKNKDNRKEKVKELTHETSNIVIPTLLVAAIGALMGKGAKANNEKLASFCSNKIVDKIAPALIGLGIGVPLAFKTTSAINKEIYKDDNKEARFRFKDFFVHLDDLVGMFVLAEVPYLDKIVDKLLPFIYAKCGYEAGDGHKNSLESKERYGDSPAAPVPMIRNR